MSRQDNKKKRNKKRKQSVLEAEIMAIMNKSLKTALDVAIDEILKSWK